MEIGWIDFSDDERNKVMDVIRQLSQPGAVDELGIGVIRDAFSDYFFPGTSTIQTRAKYFLVVPYIMKEIGDNSYNSTVPQLINELQKREKDCAVNLLKNSGVDRNGIIGRDTLPDWVVRSPSDIYWNGIRTFKIFSPYTMSIREFFSLAISRCEDRKNKGYDKAKNSKSNEYNKRSDDGDEDWDDADAGYRNGLFHWDLNEVYDPNWAKNVSIKLTTAEAKYLKSKILSSQAGSLLSYAFNERIDATEFDEFESFTLALQKAVELPEDLVKTIKLANDFNRFLLLARTRYNIIYANYMNVEWDRKWQIQAKDLKRNSSVELLEIFSRFRIKNMGLKKFLINLQKAFLENDIKKADELIIKQEKDIKTRARAKLLSDVNSRKDEWIGGEYLDYRFVNARNIINDIKMAEDTKDA